MEGIYDIEDEFWQCVSDEAKDLVQKLLQKDPEKRITLIEAINHPWVQVVFISSSHRTDPNVHHQLPNSDDHI